MHWILFANGSCTPSPHIRDLVAGADCLVGVDGGSRHLLALDIQPHIVIGDMDSIAPDTLRTYQETGVTLHPHPAKKDATDLELAMDLAFSGGATRITFLGMTGGRLDHTLANVLLLARCLDRGIPACVTNADQTIHMTDSVLNLTGCVGDTLSLVPVTPEVRGVTLTGLEYPLREATLNFASTWGMSNVLTSSLAQVRLRHGRLLVFHLHDV